MTDFQSLRAWLKAPRALVLIVVVGAAVYLPALRTPFLLDDYMHATMVDGRAGIHRGPFELYDFVNDRDRQTMIDRGLLPWWSHPQLKIRFFRPLPSALRFYEERAIGGHNEGWGVIAMHVHSWLWWLACVLLAATWYRRMLPEPVALLGTAIFALGPWHLLPLAWLANREVLLSIAFGVPALILHLRWRKERSIRDAIVATTGFALAFGCGEYSFCLGGYVLAHELCAREDRPLRRILGPLPFALPALAYLAIRARGGYGSFGSAFYADPLREPWKTLMLVPQRLTTLLAEGWLTLGTDAWGTTAPPWVVSTLVIIAGALLLVALRRTTAALPSEQRRTIVFLLLGSLGALAPVIAVVPAPRLLAISALGMAPVIALLVHHGWFPAVAEERRGAAEITALMATVMAFLHLVHGPAASLIAGLNLRDSSLAYTVTAARLNRELAARPTREVQLVRGAAGAFFGPFALAMGGTPIERWHVLSQTPHVLALRPDANTLELVTAAADGLFPDGPGNLFRDRTLPFTAGARISTPGFEVEILQVGAHGPTRARFHFEKPLESTDYLWLSERYSGLTIETLPPAGFGEPFDP